MDFLEYFYKQLTIFHYHLKSDYGVLIKAATSIAFGAVCGWIMALLTWIVYRISVYMEALPVVVYKYPDDDFDLDSETGYDGGTLRQSQSEDYNR